jgi:hypothetical protein
MKYAEIKALDDRDKDNIADLWDSEGFHHICMTVKDDKKFKVALNQLP